MNRTQNPELIIQKPEAGIEGEDGFRNYPYSAFYALCFKFSSILHRQTPWASRRQFLGRLTRVAAVACVGGIAMAGRRVLRGAVMADRPDRYPGKVIPLENVGTQAKWSG